MDTRLAGLGLEDMAGIEKEVASLGLGLGASSSNTILTSDGVRLVYERHGSKGPVVMLVHGWSGSRHYFDLNTRASWPPRLALPPPRLARLAGTPSLRFPRRRCRSTVRSSRTTSASTASPKSPAG